MKTHGMGIKAKKKKKAFKELRGHSQMPLFWACQE
jgi:hypothetical protein